ncbi:MAG: type II toxin-antitoxin system PemK/MazF family toxin [Chthoniobacteraceae bacterium]
MPKRGEVWLVDLGMAQKTRPALILSVPSGDTDRVLVTIVPHTTSLRGSAYEIGIPVPFLKEGAFLVQSITTIPARHALRFVGRLTPAQVEPIERGVRSWLGLL